MNNSGDKAVIIKEISQRMDKLEIKLKEATDINYDQDKELDVAVNNIRHLEKAMYNQQQYTRCENLEIIGIPESVPCEILEKTVLDILHKINIEVSSYEITACHRLRKKKGSKYSNIIIRFTNRKIVDQIHKKKKHLREKVKDFNIFIVKNLCPHYQSIFDFCQKMKRSGVIEKVWSYNGIVNFKYKDASFETPKNTLHYDELYDYFD